MTEPDVLLAGDLTQGTFFHVGQPHGWADGRIRVMDVELAGPALGRDCCGEAVAVEVLCLQGIDLKIGRRAIITFLGK